MRPEFSRLERPIIVNIDRLLMLLVFVQVLLDILEIKEWLARSTGGMLQSSLKTMEKATFSVTSDNLGEGTLKLSLLLLVFRSTCRQASCRSWSCWRCPSWSLFAPRWCRGSRTCPLLERRNHFKVALKLSIWKWLANSLLQKARRRCRFMCLFMKQIIWNTLQYKSVLWQQQELK